MKLMSDGLENVAGEKLKGILEKITSNKVIGVLVGTIVTAIIQSSSATTVMVVSFVNAGLMTLTQATGVILGSNIGTTITAQMVSFNLEVIAPIFIGVGAIVMTVSYTHLDVYKRQVLIYQFLHRNYIYTFVWQLANQKMIKSYF